MSGAVSYHSGLAAEESVARHYQGRGHDVAARRWRSEAGEIDLILRKGEEVIFVEVKKARSHAEAAWRLTRRQMRRLLDAANLFLGGEPRGLDSPARFDVALVDGAGRIDIIENALWT